MKNKKAIKIILVVVVLVIVLGFPGVVRYLTYRNSTTGITGLAYTRETYITGCAYWAKKEPEAEQLSDSFINTYCGCVYDDGVALYGKEEFTKMDQELTKTEVATPEINDLINTCLTKTINSGAI